MGGGSGLLCLRTTVALRIRVPPTFHPGPQLPTTAHGARPAPAHHGPAPHAICLLGQTTPPPLPPPSSQRCVLASPAPLPHHPHPASKKTGPTATQALRVAFWISGKTEGIWRDDSRRGDREPSAFKTHTLSRRSGDLFVTSSLLHKSPRII